MESQTPTFLPNASKWTIACPGLNCNRLVSLPPDSKKVQLCKHCSRAELAKEAELANRVALKEIEEEQAKYRRHARLAGNRSWRRGVKMPKLQTKVQVKKEGDKKVPRVELESVCMEQVDQPRKTFKEIMAGRNAAMRAAAGAGQYAGTSNSAISRYETNSPPIKNEPENEAELLSMRRGSPVISLLEKSLQNDSRRNRPRRSNSYNSLFVVKVVTEDEPRSLKRGRDDMSRRDRRSRNGVRELFPEKTRTKSRSTRGRRGRDSGFAPAVSPAIKAEENSSPTSKVGRHRPRRSPLRNATVMRRGELRRSRQRAFQPLRDLPRTPIKREDDISDDRSKPQQKRHP